MKTLSLQLPTFFLFAWRVSAHFDHHTQKVLNVVDELEPWAAKYGPQIDLAYTGPLSFAHLPYTRCLDDSSEAFDIAILGMPFDTATSYRPGTRFGPAAIRTGSRRQSSMGYDLSWGANPYLPLKVQDCGDVPLTPYDNALAVDQIETAYTTLLSRPVDSSISRTAHLARDSTEHPRIITLGGDHTIVWPILRSLYKVYGPISVIHFDAHIDTWPYLDRVGSSDQSRVTHGTFFTLAYEEGLMSNTSIHAGIRTKVQGPQIIEHDEQVGFELLHADDLDDFGTDYIVQQIRERVGNNPVYLSFDIDTIDPGQAPGTGTPEPAGWTSRETKRILRGLTGLNLVGADIVEVAPAYDNADTTSIIAAGLVDDFLALLVLEEPPKARTPKHRKGKYTVV